MRYYIAISKNSYRPTFFPKIEMKKLRKTFLFSPQPQCVVYGPIVRGLHDIENRLLADNLPGRQSVRRIKCQWIKCQTVKLPLDEEPFRQIASWTNCQWKNCQTDDLPVAKFWGEKFVNRSLLATKPTSYRTYLRSYCRGGPDGKGIADDALVAERWDVSLFLRTVKDGRTGKQTIIKFFIFHLLNQMNIKWIAETYLITNFLTFYYKNCI